MYNYQEQRASLFTESGQEMFIKIRDRVHSLLQVAGAFRMNEAMKATTGDSWQMLACVDRLVEMGEIREVAGYGGPGQHRVFVKS